MKMIMKQIKNVANENMSTKQIIEKNPSTEQGS